jgi:thiopeptide-type bacteriocin biosynthesis protein
MLEGDWVAAHLYYAADTDRLLVEFVAPFVQELRASGELRRYFFIRYGTGGPHLRVRILPSAGADAEGVRARLLEGARAYMQRRPSRAPVHALPGGSEYYQSFDPAAPDDGQPQPDNTAVAAEYSPETDRYGGPARAEPIYRHFERSSDLTLSLLKGGSHRQRVDTALRLMVLLPTIVWGGRADALHFFRTCHDFWLDRLPPGTEQGKMLAEWEPIYTRTRDLFAWELNPARQEEALSAAPYALAWARLWREAESDLADWLAELPGEQPVQARVVLMHLFMNRFGLSPLDEAFLAYGVLRTIRQLEGREPCTSAPTR